MTITFLSDDVINSKELRDNQKYWFEKASINPVSIKSGTRKLVLLNREHAKHMYSLSHYAGMIIQFCRERIAYKGESSIFPWIKYLDNEAIEEFNKELLVTFEGAMSSQEWSAFEELLDDWKATANIASNPDLAKALLAEEDSSAYVRIKD